MRYTLILKGELEDDPMHLYPVIYFFKPLTDNLPGLISFVSDEKHFTGLPVEIRNTFLPATENGRIMYEFFEGEEHGHRSWGINTGTYIMHCKINRSENMTMEISRELGIPPDIEEVHEIIDSFDPDGIMDTKELKKLIIEVLKEKKENMKQ